MTYWIESVESTIPSVQQIHYTNLYTVLSTQGYRKKTISEYLLDQSNK